MTRDEIEKTLTSREKWACRTLSHLRSERELFIDCPMNRAILKAAKWMLNGRDPVDFIEYVLGMDDEFQNDMQMLKELNMPLRDMIT